VIATNFHVIRGAHEGYARLVGHDTRYQILGVLAADKEEDLAVVSIGGDIATEPLPLSQSSAPAVGDTIYVLGNPEGLEGTFSQGIISGIRDGQQTAFLQITAPISHGSSGGPVLDKGGSVIGVACATYDAGQNLNFAIPVTELIKLLSRTGPLMPLSSIE
jgi:S1-C subfamily serine protease